MGEHGPGVCLAVETYTPRLIMNSWGQLTLAASTASWNRYQLLMIRSILLAVPPVMTFMPRSRDQAIVGTLDVARRTGDGAW